ncbi:MAG: fucose isomerase [candidate division KSB1 bacterium]|nr:fucose isomerase [candidate division KSB1 bacterium]MDZ7304775.1 fucose isomerase [candidate division KSB1 bacterium]MDZ7314436.1 fucose isomerase [candidate division KSB1 bacterium]
MKTIYLVANGDLRLAANQNCEAAQAEMEKQIVAAVEQLGGKVKRAHPYDPEKKHGFIDSQKYGIAVFNAIPKKAPLIVAEAVWQYSHHILPGLFTHEGPILTIANWSGQWPGLVGLLNLNASLTKAGVKYSTLWSEDFTDDFFVDGLQRWMKKGRIKHDLSHVVPYKQTKVPAKAEKIGTKFAQAFRSNKAIMGVFDEGCMGMYNAIIPDELLHPTGVFKERLSQSTLYAKMLTVSEAEARQVYEWLLAKGMKFQFGKDEATDLTERQVLEQCKMYIAAVRLADEFGCAAIGIQYQQGLKDLAPASDLVEGLLNNVDRPPVYHEQTGQELFKGEALPHFNEVDECAGLDALVTYRLWKELGFPPENTLHDLRWGRHYKGDGIDDFVWVLEISGAAPPEHFIGGYAGASSERQPPMYFRLGGGTVKGVSKPGYIVWSRVFIANGRLQYDIGIAEVVKLPEEETQERWRLTTSQWPIMHAIMKGITRDQMMARHKSNHIHVVYAPDLKSAQTGMFAKAAAMRELGLKVHFCGAI